MLFLVQAISQKKIHGINRYKRNAHAHEKYVIAKYSHDYLFASYIIIVNALTITSKRAYVKYFLGDE